MRRPYRVISRLNNNISLFWPFSIRSSNFSDSQFYVASGTRDLVGGDDFQPSKGTGVATSTEPSGHWSERTRLWACAPITPISFCGYYCDLRPKGTTQPNHNSESATTITTTKGTPVIVPIPMTIMMFWILTTYDPRSRFVPLQRTLTMNPATVQLP